MTQRDKKPGMQSRGVKRYFAFKDEVRLRRVMVPECNYWITFVMPMPPSWSESRKRAMDGAPHQAKPDKDNLEKGLFDAIYDDDSKVWHGGSEKRWGLTGKIIVRIGHISLTG